MGALTSHNKRDPFPISPDYQVSKKRRLSFMNQNHSQTPGSSSVIASHNLKKIVEFSNSTVSRLSRYPESTQKYRREVHAPCRTTKFGLPRSTDTDSSGKKEHFIHSMGNLLSRKLESTKRLAFGAIRYIKNDKQVIEVDIEAQKSRKEAASEDSSIEVIEVIEEDQRERRPIELDQGLRDRVVIGRDDDDVRIVEERSVVTVDGGEKLDLVVELDVEDVGAYKKLLETANKRDGRLKVLDSNIEMLTRRLSYYQSTRPVKKPADEDLSQEAFTPLTEEEESEVQNAFSRQCRRKVLVTHMNSNIEITGEILSCLKPIEWLNDEVINLYLELLKEREKREPQKFLKCHFFNTFFYKKLTSGATKTYDYKAVRRWTTERKLGYFLIDCDKIFVPVHKDIHWCLAIINKKDQKFQYLDSLKGRDYDALEFLAKYFVDEVKDKSKMDIDVSNWEREFLEDIPAQRNGYDCGVFMIKYADFYSRDFGLCFSQEHMAYFRMRTAKEILRLRAD